MLQKATLLDHYLHYLFPSTYNNNNNNNNNNKKNMGRAPCCDKANVKRGPWSPEEDAKLKDYIEKYGTGGNWIALPQKAGLKRCGKSCRLRWLNYLRPNIKHGEFSCDEDRVICSLYASIGSRWSIIAAQLPGRTDNDIKNYWNTKLKKKLMGSNNTTNNMISSTNPSQILMKKYNHNQNPMISSSLSSQSPLSYDPYHYTNNTPHYNNSSSNNTSSMTMSFSNNSTLLHPPLTMQGKDNSTLLMFGGDQQQPPQQPSTTTTTCSSSDGSISIKCEDHNYNINNVNIFGSYNNNGVISNNTSMLWGQDSHQNNPLLEYGLDEIKQLISTTTNNDVNYFDENKVYYY